MTKLKIPNAEVQELLSGKSYKYLKYTTQIMNLANQNAQGTRANIVGQMSDLIQEFEGETLSEWEKWYLAKYPEAIDRATEKVYAMVLMLQEAILQIDRSIVREWIDELVIVKTFSGLRFQEAVLKKMSLHFHKPYRLATPEEERKSIDGFLADKPVSIKPATYKVKLGLNEYIDVPTVFYTKTKSDIVIEFDSEDFA